MFLLLLVSLLPLTFADCGCEEVWQEIEKERKLDEEHHGCRSCKVIDPSDEASGVGFDCSDQWTFTTNVLTPDARCRCSEAKCTGNAKLFADQKMAPKLRCNNSQWIVNNAPVDRICCAKPCGSSVCKDRHPLASSDFAPLAVSAAGVAGKCATGTCDPSYGMAEIKDDGTLDVQMPPNTQVICSGKRVWKSGSWQSKYVMCNASPCGPSKCPPLVMGPLLISGEVVPLSVTGRGASCAVATCPGEYNTFVQMSAEGSIIAPFAVGALQIFCSESGKWETTYDYVMCQKQPCPGGCDITPFKSLMLSSESKPVPLYPSIRNGCAYSCPTGMSLFTERQYHAISIVSAVCVAGGKFQVGNGMNVDRIGCWECDLENGLLPATTKVRPMLTNCVAACPPNYYLQYETTEGPRYANTVLQLSRAVTVDYKGVPQGYWFDWDNAAMPTPRKNMEFTCLQVCTPYPYTEADCLRNVNNMGTTYKCVKPTVFNGEVVCPPTRPNILLYIGEGSVVKTKVVDKVTCDATGLEWKFVVGSDPAQAIDPSFTEIGCTDFRDQMNECPTLGVISKNQVESAFGFTKYGAAPVNEAGFSCTAPLMLVMKIFDGSLEKFPEAKSMACKDKTWEVDNGGPTPVPLQNLIYALTTDVCCAAP